MVLLLERGLSRSQVANRLGVTQQAVSARLKADGVEWRSHWTKGTGSNTTTQGSGDAAVGGISGLDARRFGWDSLSAGRPVGGYAPRRSEIQDKRARKFTTDEMVSLFDQGLNRAGVAARLGVAPRSISDRLKVDGVEWRSWWSKGRGPGGASVQPRGAATDGMPLPGVDGWPVDDPNFVDRDLKRADNSVTPAQGRRSRKFSTLDMVSLLESGLSRAEVAARLGVTQQAISARLKTDGVEWKKGGGFKTPSAGRRAAIGGIPSGTDNSRGGPVGAHVGDGNTYRPPSRRGRARTFSTEEMVSLFEQGLNRSEVAARLGVTPRSIAERLKSDGVEWKSGWRKGRAGRTKLGNRKRTVAGEFPPVARAKRPERRPSEITLNHLRALMTEGVTQSEAARRLGVDEASFERRVREEGLTWPNTRKKRERKFNTEDMVAFFDEGLTRAEVAQRLGVPVQAVTDRLKAEGVYWRGHWAKGGPLPPIALEELRTLMAAGFTQSEAARRLGVEPASIKRRLKNEGLVWPDTRKNRARKFDAAEAVALLDQGFPRSVVARRMAVTEAILSARLEADGVKWRDDWVKGDFSEVLPDVPRKEIPEAESGEAAEAPSDPVSVESDAPLRDGEDFPARRVARKRPRSFGTEDAVTRAGGAGRLTTSSRAASNSRKPGGGKRADAGQGDSRPRITPSVLRELMDQGISQSEAARRLGVDRSTLSRQLKAEGLSWPDSPWKRAANFNADDVVGLLDQGIPLAEVGQRLGVSSGMVKLRLKAENVAWRDNWVNGE